MGVNPEAARQFLSVAIPFYVLWFLMGIVIAVLYHLSLY